MATEPIKTFDQLAEMLLVPRTADTSDELEEAQEADETDEADKADEDEQDSLEESEETEDGDAEEAADDDDDDDDDDDAEQDAGEEQPQVFTVKVDGEERQVTLEDLKRSYSGQAYIQKGMEEAAAARKQAEQAYLALQKDREALSQLWQQIQQGGVMTPPQPPDRSLLRTDPIAYMEQMAEYEDAKQAYQQQQQQLQQVSQQQTEAELRAFAKYRMEQDELLKKAIPELSDPAKERKIKQSLFRIGRDVYGYTDEELMQVFDHRAIRVLDDARRWHELQAAKVTTNKKAEKARPVVKPSARKRDSAKVNFEKRLQVLKKTGRIEDAAALLFNSEE